MHTALQYYHKSFVCFVQTKHRRMSAILLVDAAACRLCILCPVLQVFHAWLLWLVVLFVPLEEVVYAWVRVDVR